VLNLASSLQRDGHFTEVVTYDLYNTEPLRAGNALSAREYSYQNIPVVALRHKTMPVDVHSALDDVEVYRFAVEFLRKRKPFDVLHCAHAMRVTSFLKAAHELSLPYVVTLTDFWFICPKIILKTSSGDLCAGPEGGAACRRLCPELPPKFVGERLASAREMLFGAKAVVSPSRFLAAIFKKEFPELEISIIHHGMDSRSLRANLKTYRRGDPIVFGYTGGLAPHKGVHLLLEAFRALQASNAQLKVYGSYSHEMEYAQLLIKIAEGDKRIEFCGTYKPTDAGDILQGIDVVVVPSTWYENYPLALHEALACNVPVIAADIGGSAEAIRNSVNGFLFRAGDASDLKSKLQEVLENPEVLNTFKHNLALESPLLTEEEAYLYERLYRMRHAQKHRGAS
jgi:glycosyltransferase involved in cell wall biosynthesis